MIFRKPVDRDWPGFVMDFLFQLALLVGLGALSLWLWPAGMFETPIAGLTIGNFLWGGASVISWAVTALASYFIVIELGIALWKGLRVREGLGHQSEDRATHTD